MLVFSSAEITKSPSPSGVPSQMRWYKSRTRTAFVSNAGSRGKIHVRCVHGLIPSSCSHFHNVVVPIDSTIFFSITCSRISLMLNRERGSSSCAGSSHATALTDATPLGGKASRSPAARMLLQRLEPFLEEPLAQLAHEGTADIQTIRDQTVVQPCRQIQHDPCSHHLPIGRVRRARPPFDHRPFFFAQFDRIRTLPGHTHPPKAASSLLCRRT